MSLLTSVLDRGVIPDPLIRVGIRRLLRRRLHDEMERHARANGASMSRWADELRGSPIAVSTDAANEQHYEVPCRFFELVLGPHLKYSSALWPDGVVDLDGAEEAMLDLTCERADLRDGQDVLELGCGWGSLTLWMAERYPRSRVLAVSNSATQRLFILDRARARGLDNVEVVTHDMNGFDVDRTFDRVVSVEMFEHMRNYEELLGRVAGWLRDDGRLFVHVFAHREYAYPFETEGDDNWMGRYFFTGGQMPSHGLLPSFDRDVVVEQEWVVGGEHYARTSEAWLANLDRNREEVHRLFARHVRRGGRLDVGRALEGLLHGVRGALRLPRRRGVVGLPLPVPATMSRSPSPSPTRSPWRSLSKALLQWVDTSVAPTGGERSGIDWLRVIPFVAVHLTCLLVLGVGGSPIAVAVAVGLYALRMFAITGFYHRYFSHRSFKTSRPAQFVFALLGASAVQRGPLWWAGHHRLHHRHSDEEGDAHSPVKKGFLWSHMGWFLSRENFPTPRHVIRDFDRYPELRFIDRFDTLIPFLLALSLLIIGEVLERTRPGSAPPDRSS